MKITKKHGCGVPAQFANGPRFVLSPFRPEQVRDGHDGEGRARLRFRLRAILLAALIATASAAVMPARANILIDATLNDPLLTAHVQFVTDVLHQEFDATRFLLATSSRPGIPIVEFVYDLALPGTCFGLTSPSQLVECFLWTDSLEAESPLAATADPHVFQNPLVAAAAQLTWSITDLPITTPVPEPTSLSLLGLGLAGLGFSWRRRST